MTTGADGKSDDHRTVSMGRMEGSSTREGEDALIDDAREDGSLGYNMSGQDCRAGSLGTTKSDSLEGVIRPARGTPGGLTITPEGV
jgi:hypothetical protein